MRIYAFAIEVEEQRQPECYDCRCRAHSSSSICESCCAGVRVRLTVCIARMQIVVLFSPMQFSKTVSRHGHANMANKSDGTPNLFGVSSLIYIGVGSLSSVPQNCRSVNISIMNASIHSNTYNEKKNMVFM